MTAEGDDRDFWDLLWCSACGLYAPIATCADSKWGPGVEGALKCHRQKDGLCPAYTDVRSEYGW